MHFFFAKYIPAWETPSQFSNYDILCIPMCLEHKKIEYSIMEEKDNPLKKQEKIKYIHCFSMEKLF